MGGKQSLVLFVPVPHLAHFQKIIKERRIIRRESRNTRALKQLRPRNRSLTVVHDNILEDLVYPTEIVGKRTRVRADGSKLIKVHLHHETKPHNERIETFGKVYKNLTGKDVVFEFPTH